jgi:hypothetical protein
MLVDSSNSSAVSAVTGAIHQAASATGTSFQYLLATAQVESGLNPQAGASTSSARGLFQFIDQTWLATMKQAGPSLGYGQYASAITKNAFGQYEVQDPAMRNEILKLRNDPTANAVMAGAFTQANAALLSGQLGRAPSEGELYIAHFLGAGGAAHLISAAGANPNASAANYFPNAASANPSIFYDRSTGEARSLAQVRDVLTARYDVAARTGNSAVAQASGVDTAMLHPIPPMPIPSVSGAAAVSAGSSAAATSAPDTAGMTNAFAAAAPQVAAQDKDVFHGLFSDPGRSTPVAAVVSQLWGASGLTGTTTPSAGAMMDLFKDNGEHNT